jgi:hypothetical protein
MCVLVLLYFGPRTTIYVSSCPTILVKPECVLMSYYIGEGAR